VVVSASFAAVAQTTPWKWDLTINDQFGNALETKSFTSRAEAEYYLWSSSPLNDTLREVSYVRTTDRSEYKYAGSRYTTTPGPYQFQAPHVQKVGAERWEWVWSWYESEAQADRAYQDGITFWWGPYNGACNPIIERKDWRATPPDPFARQQREYKITRFMQGDGNCREDLAIVGSEFELSRQRITNHDYVKQQDGNFFGDPAPFTGQVTSEILHDGPPGSDGNFSQDEWSVRSRRTAKLIGQPNVCAPIKGNPCDISRGSKHEAAADSQGLGLLDLVRQYNSTDSGGSFGRGWRGPFEYVLMRAGDGNSYVLTAPDGKQTNLTTWAGAVGNSTMYRSQDNRSVTLTRYYDAEVGERVRVEFPDRSLLFGSPTKGTTAKPSEITYGGDRTVSLRYDALDRLERAEYLGRSVTYLYEYADTERTHKVTGAVLPDGRRLTYEYSATGLLERVSDAAGERFRYGYKPGTSLLASILEGGEHRRDYQYDDLRRLIGSTNGPAAHTYSYTPTQTRVTFPSGRQEVTDFESSVLRRPLREEVVGGLITTTAYTDYNDTITETNNAGLKTVTKYDSTTQTVTAYLNGTLDRTRVTTFEAGTSRPTRVEIRNASGSVVQRTDYAYNSRRQLAAVTQVDPTTSEQRTVAFGYCEDSDLTDPASTCTTVGALKSSDGPRTDVNDVLRYAYYVSDAPSCATPSGPCPYRQGDLRKVSDPLGHSYELLAYDGGGRVVRSRDANGVITQVDYDGRGRPIAQIVRGPDDAVETDDRITRFEYRPSGAVKQVTLPDGTYIRFTYDPALRLTDITDSVGDTVHYTLDDAGHRKQEDTQAGGVTVRRTLSRVFNALGQLEAVKDAAQNATGLRYDLNENPDRITDAMGRKNDQVYDPIGRLTQILQDVGGLEVKTQIRYTALDQIAQVTDPKGLNTVYSYNGFGEQTQVTSPDTGVTDYTYTAAGLLATRKDANDAAAHKYSYDALNRPTAIFYSATGPADVEYTYDTVNAECAAEQTFALGRLTATRTEGIELKYCYDRFGQVVRKVQIVAGKSFTLQYAYTPAGNVSTITYPDGAVVDYVRDGKARIKEIGIRPNGGTRTTLLSNATYEPFGPATGWTYGNGRSLGRTYDRDYRPKSILDSAAGGLSMGYGYNTVGDLTELKDGLFSINHAKYDYDTLSRLTVTRDGASSTPLETYGYDKTGNRSSVKRGTVTESYTYPVTSHRLTKVGTVARAYDAAGNTISIGGTARQFVYNANDRLSQLKLSGTVKASYRYNSIGQRVATTESATNTIDTYTLYDEAGKWIGDYDAQGNAKQQAVWFGTAPVGLLVGSGISQTLKYVEPDHLGTPRAVIDPTRNVAIWTWDAKSEMFGNSPPNQDPDLDGTAFVFNMRFPGQRFDAASGLVHNYFRDYDPSIGRYIQSDPIGLSGGVSTYLYVNGAPGSLSDMYGLATGLIECARCVGSPDKPSHDSWSMMQVNPAFRDKISVSTEDGVVVIRGDLTVSGVGSTHAAKDINRYWNGASGIYEGTEYRSEINVTRVNRNGDVTIKMRTVKDWERRNASLCSGVSAASADVGGPEIMVAPYPSLWQADSVIAHEFGHNLGLDHAPKGQGTMMGYDEPPKLMGRDLFNVASGYKK
jgi:RHS repeat-associated protein